MATAAIQFYPNEFTVVEKTGEMKIYVPNDDNIWEEKTEQFLMDSVLRVQVLAIAQQHLTIAQDLFNDRYPADVIAGFGYRESARLAQHFLPLHSERAHIICPYRPHHQQRARAPAPFTPGKSRNSLVGFYP
jgi:hypothetical protein